MRRNYYNEIDKYCAAWLRNLISAGLIAPGDVDERSILDVRANDLRGYTQCHFFAGLGGWSRALRLAGWPDDRPVWTGSCPCQPFSAAGAGKAADDSRHLWPAWFPLIAECKPSTILGEQVEAAIGWGWLDLVLSDLESQGYACGAAVLPACGVGAPHIRQRLWFVADASNIGHERHGSARRWWNGFANDGYRGGCGDADVAAIIEGPACTSRIARDTIRPNGAGELADTARRNQRRHCGEPRGAAGGMDNGECNGWRALGENHGRHVGIVADATGEHNFWSAAEWLPCTDGKARPTQPGIFPLAYGLPARVAKLRAAGNAIVPQVAAEFIRAIL